MSKYSARYLISDFSAKQAGCEFSSPLQITVCVGSKRIDCTIERSQPFTSNMIELFNIPVSANTNEIPIFRYPIRLLRYSYEAVNYRKAIKKDDKIFSCLSATLYALYGTPCIVLAKVLESNGQFAPPILRCPGYIGIEYASLKEIGTHNKILYDTSIRLGNLKNVKANDCLNRLRYFEIIPDHRICFDSMYSVLENLGDDQWENYFKTNPSNETIARNIHLNWNRISSNYKGITAKAFLVLTAHKVSSKRVKLCMKNLNTLRIVRNCLTHKEFRICPLFNRGYSAKDVGKRKWTRALCANPNADFCKKQIFSEWNSAIQQRVMLSAYTIGKLRALLQFILLSEVGCKSSICMTYFNRFIRFPF